MTDLTSWLEAEEAKIAANLHPELAANAAKVRAAQDPNKPGAEKPDLYGKGKGIGKGGRKIPTRDELEGDGKTRAKKIAGKTFDTVDKDFLDWMQEIAEPGYPKTATVNLKPAPNPEVRRAMATGAAAAVPIAVLGTIGVQKALKAYKERKAKEAQYDAKPQSWLQKGLQTAKTVAKVTSASTNPAGAVAAGLGAITKKIMAPKVAAMTPNPENEELLKRVLGRLQGTTSDVR